MTKPYIALVGRPNTGKSTLFNRLAGRRIAIVEDTPGVTRDRIIAEGEWLDNAFFIIDTGGIEPDSDDVILSQMRSQANLAMDMADVIIFVADGREGVTADDREIATMIRKFNKGVILAVNKLDDYSQFDSKYEFYELGLGEPYVISAEHGNGVGDLLDRAVELFPEEKKVSESDNRRKIAVVGKPNAGKSTLVNTLLGEERVIVSDIAGTTRDAIDTEFSYNGEEYLLIDTAGIRKKTKSDSAIDYYSSVRALKAIERSDVCLLLIDGSVGVTEHDIKIAGMIKEAFKAMIIVVNKWDLVEKDTNTMSNMKKEILKRLHFVDWAPVEFISALTNSRVGRLMPIVEEVLENYSMRINTGLLNDAVGDAVMITSPPIKKGRQLRFYYTSQPAVCPPTFVMFVNDDTLVSVQYEKYLEGRLRTAFGFKGTPIKFIYRNKSEK
ncbi:MAG: ribosome biogenesis GTPase Der [Eubacteriaceae bacterium]|nr:ribosome biogenesis GTPase Der [Eubacteriaceae bacterium]